MKGGEIIRIIVFSLVGAALMFLVQPWFYQNRIIGIADVRKISVWLGDYYTTGATIVFAVSVVSTVLWYVMAAKAKVGTGGDVAQWQVVWWLFLLLPVLSICVAIYFFNGSHRALLSLTGFFVFDVLILFWLPTATSSPGSLIYIPPGAILLRRIIGAR